MNHLIIGTGPAGVVAAETLRRHNPDCDITIIGEEDGLPYSRMALPYLLSGRIDADGTLLRRDAEHYEKLGIQRHRGRVRQISAEAQTLQLEDGDEWLYDRLLIATGCKPADPGIPGMDLPDVKTCWTLADGLELVRRLRPELRVVMIGAGFIALTIMESLLRRGVRLTIVEAQDRLIPAMVNATGGALLQKWCETRGVSMRLQTRVLRMEGQTGAGVTLTLAGGEVLAADLVIVAAGVVPAVDFLRDSGLEIDRGIRVDRLLRTSDPNIFAAGNVAQARDLSSDQEVIQALQTTAVEHGRIAGMNMAGMDVYFRGTLAMNVLDAMGMVCSSFGLVHGVAGGDESESLSGDGLRYLRLQFDEDRLVGATVIGTVRHIGAIRGLIQSNTSLGKWKKRLMQNPEYFMEAWLDLVKHGTPVY
ncbi:MAG: FAD-dependent pyridine nucleotide-disulfide oxidoreductase [Magnetococcales bacterium]|nr:FAD-dependent pyridine nucleotide-disulfide oxidoreductase [Magnetococcales bacterium]